MTAPPAPPIDPRLLPDGHLLGLLLGDPTKYPAESVIFPLVERTFRSEPVDGKPPTRRKVQIAGLVRLEVGGGSLPLPTLLQLLKDSGSRLSAGGLDVRVLLVDGSEEVSILAADCTDGGPRVSWQVPDESNTGFDRELIFTATAEVEVGGDGLVEWEQSVQLIDVGPFYEPRTFAGVSPVLIRRDRTFRVLTQRGTAVGLRRQPLPPDPLLPETRLDPSGPSRERPSPDRYKVSWNYVMAAPDDYEIPPGVEERPAVPLFAGTPEVPA